jgi:hypothetical protein
VAGFDEFHGLGIPRSATSATFDFPDEFFRAQSPILLYQLMMAIDSSSRPDAESKRRPVIRLVDRKPIGNA